MSQVNAEVEQIRADIAAQQDEATKKVNELLDHLEERRQAAKQEADELIGQAKTVREDADDYAADKRQAAEAQAAEIVRKAGETAAAQVEERRQAAKAELDELQHHISELQQRESTITQRVSELRAMFSNAFAGFGAFAGAPDAGLPVANAVDGETPRPQEPVEGAAHGGSSDEEEPSGQQSANGDQAE